MENLKTNLREILDDAPNIGIKLYAILRETQNEPKKLDISSRASPKLKEMFFNEIEQVFFADEVQLMNLSSSDERANAIYKYDLDIPDELEVLNHVLTTDNHVNFNFDQNDLNGIKAFVIEIGNSNKQIVLYKTLAPIHVYGRSSFFLKKSAQRFDQIEEEFLRISPSFQMMLLNDELFVLDLKTLERFFGFHDVIKKEALAGVEAITNMAILENPDVLSELIDDLTFARKLTKVAKGSPIISMDISNSMIIEFCKKHLELKKIKLSHDESQILLDTKVSKNLFVRLLMDDYLNSDLTHNEYVSVAKDALKHES